MLPNRFIEADGKAFLREDTRTLRASDYLRPCFCWYASSFK